MRGRLRPVVLGVIAFNVALIGVALLLRRLIPSIGDEQSDEIALAAAGNGIELSSRAQSFRGGSARAIMGVLELDLTRARLDADGARLSVRAIMGGAEILVPADWPLRVLSERAIAGGIDHPAAAGSEDDEGPVLALDLLAIMGGIEVRRRPRRDDTEARSLAPDGADRG